jgi:putative sigma-54 modulation protein
MNLTISGHHLEVTPALREYVLTKLDRVTRHFDQVVDINVLLTVEKLKEKERRQRAEVTLHVKGKDIFVENAHEDLYAAIDQLMDKLDRQVCRHKDKLQDHHHASAKRIDAACGPLFRRRGCCNAAARAQCCRRCKVVQRVGDLVSIISLLFRDTASAQALAEIGAMTR